MAQIVTIETIQAYQNEVEKGKIKSNNMPPCPGCLLESKYFKFHAFRERFFLVIVQMFVIKVPCTLYRFKCPDCGKTFTNYPDFAIPNIHYVLPVIVEFSSAYVEPDQMTYKKAVMVNYSVPGYPDNERTLSPSTIHRWITTLEGFSITCQNAMSLLLQKDPGSRIREDLAQLKIPAHKYRSSLRKNCLHRCRSLLIIGDLFQAAFKISIFTEFGTLRSYR